VSGLDLQVLEVLERHVPVRGESEPEWDDVLARAGVLTGAAPAAARPRAAARRRPARLVLALAAAALALAAVSPLGAAVAGLSRDAFDGLSSWLRGEPGEPATPAEQAGFAARNDASYAAFPSGTTVRSLARVEAGGHTFSLLGFRNATSLCLRLVRADLPAGRGANQCVTLRELRASPAPALVASEAWFRVGDPEASIEGIFGFADNTVETIEVRRARSGWGEARVVANVFVALRARRAGTVRNPPPRDQIVQVRAVGAAGDVSPVPFVARDFGDYGGGIPERPSYLDLTPLKAADLPGPAAVEAEFAGGTIGWVSRRVPRGEEWAPDQRSADRLGKILFSRSIRPDPGDPHRIGIASVEIGSGWGSRTLPSGTRVLCYSDLRPLQRGETGAACAPELFERGRPLTFSYRGPEQITLFSGLAADGVARIDLYLASGRRVPAALRDNAFTVSAPAAQLPGKLVAKDRDGRVVGIDLISGAARPAPCPPAVFARSTAELPPPAPYERLDLGTGKVNGQPIFGRSVAQVTAALGKPDRIAFFSRINGHREPTLFYGGTTPGGAALLVRFGWRQQRLRAISLGYRGPSLVDERLGHVLRLQPGELQDRIAAAYGSEYDLMTAYGSDPSRGCGAIFRSSDRAVTLSLVLNPRRPAQPSLTLHHGF
jgi:hypothetical protein